MAINSTAPALTSKGSFVWYDLPHMKDERGDRIAVFIDGGNFYQRIKELDLLKSGKFSYSAFAKHLAHGRTITSTKYYIGIVRDHDHTERSKKLVESQQKFLAHLENEDLHIGRGRIVYDHKTREKGVDVMIAVDLVVGAVEDTYDIAMVISSDTDLIPAVRYVRSKGKIVEYVGFSHRPSLGMTKECTESILLPKEELNRFVEPALFEDRREAA